MVRVAALAHAVGEPEGFDAFAAVIGRQVAAAAEAGGQLLVLPEYLSLEMAAWLPETERADFVRSLDALQPLEGAYLDLMQGLARRHGVWLVAGSLLTRGENGRYRNRSWLVSPQGGRAFQDKLTLTAFERDSGVLEPGDALRVFESPFGRIGILVCYDIQFPHFARAQAEAGARLLLVPSCTDTAAGAHRVRLGCQARALENRLHVACAVTTGEAPWSPALDTNTGRAAILAPMDRGFPDDGILGEAADGWAIADVDPGAPARRAAEAQVSNARDWPEQFRPAVLRARVEGV